MAEPDRDPSPTPPPIHDPELVAQIERMRLEEDQRKKDGNKTGGYRFTNRDDIESQRGVMWEVIKKVGSAVFQGNLANVSLPVRIFEPRSFLERLTDNWSYQGSLLYTASQTPDPLQRFRLVIAFVIGGLRHTCCAAKPFNPILGETFQGVYEDGATVFCEQTSHHPPISHFMLLGSRGAFTITGYAAYTASVRGNSVKGQQTGPNNLVFHDGVRYTFELPHLWLTGIMWGTRVMDYGGKCVVEDHTNHLRCEIQFNPEAVGWIASFFVSAKKPTDFFRGELFTVSGPPGKHQQKRKIGTCEGSWLDSITFDESQTLWRYGVTPPSRLSPAPDPLPSDSRFRGDLVNLRQRNMVEAEEAKLAMEVQQRHDAKLRKDAAPHHGRKH